MSEISAIRSGSLDEAIRNEVRAVLARKYGKRLLDSWVPPVEDVRGAVGAGPVSEEEV
jgi:bromodomain-containing protein 8